MPRHRQTHEMAGGDEVRPQWGSLSGSTVTFTQRQRSTVVDSSLTVTEVQGANPYIKLAVTNPAYRDALLLNFSETTDLANPLTVSATTWTDLKGNQNFTVVNANHLIDVFLDLSAGIFDDAIAIGDSLIGAVRIVIDSAGTPANYYLSGARGQAAILNNESEQLNGAAVCIGTLSAGVHTIKVQVWANVALNTGSSGFYLRASTDPNFEFMHLQVIERGGY